MEDAPATRAHGGRQACTRTLAAIPVKLAAVAIQIAVVTLQFAPLMAGSAIVAVVEVTPEFAAIVPDFRLVVPYITAQSAISVPGKRGRHTESHQ
jgi:hypothetical protein